MTAAYRLLAFTGRYDLAEPRSVRMDALHRAQTSQPVDTFRFETPRRRLFEMQGDLRIKSGQVGRAHVGRNVHRATACQELADHFGEVLDGVLHHGSSSSATPTGSPSWLATPVFADHLNTPLCRVV